MEKEIYDILMKQADNNISTALKNQIQRDVGGTSAEAIICADHILNLLDAHEKFKNTSNRYIAYAIIFDPDDKNPKYSNIGIFSTLENACSEIRMKRLEHRVLLAWIDSYSDNVFDSVCTTIWHECYIDQYGYLYQPMDVDVYFEPNKREDAIHALQEELKSDLNMYRADNTITQQEESEVLDDFNEWCEGAKNGDAYYFSSIRYTLKY
jgi:hypothetical protein